MHDYILSCVYSIYYKNYVFIVLLADQIVDANSVNEICTKYSVMWRQIGLKLGLDASVLGQCRS